MQKMRNLTERQKLLKKKKREEEEVNRGTPRWLS